MRFKSLHFISPNNTRNTYHRQISLTGTDHSNSKLSKYIHFNEKIKFSVMNFFSKCDFKVNISRYKQCGVTPHLVS